MRTSTWLLAVGVSCLGAASSASAQQVQFTPFTANSGTSMFSPFTSNGTPIQQPFASTTPNSSNGSQPTFPAPGASLAGPSRLTNLIPGLHGLTNTHYIGSSMFPSDTSSYLAMFGYQRLR